MKMEEDLNFTQVLDITTHCWKQEAITYSRFIFVAGVKDF